MPPASVSGNRLVRPLGALALLVALAARLPAATPRDELLRFVPDDVGFCLLLQDLRGHTADLLASPFVEQFRKSPAGKALATAPELRWLTAVQDEYLKKHLKIGWKELRDDILGEAVVFAYRPGPPDRPEDEQGLVLLHARSARALADLVERFNQSQKGGDLKEVLAREHNGVTYYRRVERKKSTYYYLRGPVLLFTGQEDMLRQAIDQDRALTAAAEPPLARRLREMGLERSLFVWWANPRAFDAQVAAKVARAQPAAAAALKTFAVYWKAIDGIALALALDRDVSLSLAVRGRPEQLPAPARRFLTRAARPSEVWRAFPDQALLAVGMRIDPTALADVLGEFLTPQSRQALQKEVNRPLSATLGKDFLTQVLPAVGPDWGLCVLAPPARDKSWLPQVLFAVRMAPGAEDAAADRAVYRALASWAHVLVFVLTRQHPDEPVALRTATQDRHEVKYLEGKGAFPPGVQPAFTLRDGYLVFASSLEALRRFVPSPRGEGNDSVPLRPSGPPADATTVPLLRLSFKECRAYLQDRREALAGALAARGPLTREQALARLDQVIAGLQLLDRLEVRQRTTPNQVTLTLSLRTTPPLRSPAAKRAYTLAGRPPAQYCQGTSLRGRSLAGGWCAMKLLRLLSALALVVMLAAVSAAWQYTPPKSEPPDAATRKTIEERTEKLGQLIGQLRAHGVRDPILADVEVYHKAARWIVRFNEFYQKTYPQWTVEALDRGLLRAGQAGRNEWPWLFETGRPVVRGYRSLVDGSVQPYAVTLPADYGKDVNKKYRIDVVLHGRNSSLTEVSFLHDHGGDRPAPRQPARGQKKDGGKERPAARGQEFIRIDIYGRGNNAYRWAGESDVREAVDNFLTVENVMGRGRLLNPRRTVLRGFSMGGAGTWHLGLHRPDRWSVLGPGAGFVSTHGYVKGLPEKLPDYQEKCLRIYDAVDYAENAADVPVVAYAGADDPQLAAAKKIEAKLKPLGIPMTLLVAPGLGHKFPPEWQKKAEAEYAKHLTRDRPEYPEHVHFVTYTVKYPVCYWVEVMAQDRQYERSLVDAKRDSDEGFTVKTENVHALHLGLWPGATRESLVLNIDGQRLEASPYMENTPARGLHFYLERTKGKWSVALPERLFTRRLRNPQKTTHLQGPIDDAFMRPFLCVRGTHRAWNEATERYAEANLERFQEEWAKYFRGELPVKDDTEVTPEDIATHHLVLFGDPSSNSLIEQVLPGLPLTWTKEQIVWDDKKYSAGDHVPVMIYPSPLTTNRYVVLNSGHTFHAKDFQGTNALLYPRLGDYAILKLTPDKKDPLAAEVITAGLFDIHWRTPRTPGAR